MKNTRNKKGFTLVEVIIVLVIMVIVAALAGPNIIGWIDHTENKNCKAVTMNMLDEITSACSEKRFSGSESMIESVNNAILSIVKFYANNNSLTVKNTLEKYTTTTTGICPHGGESTIKWRFDITGLSFGVTLSAKCDRHGEEHTLNISLSLREEPPNGGSTLPPSLETTVKLIADVNDFMLDIWGDGGKPELRAEAFLEAFAEKIENDTTYRKFFSQENVDEFKFIMSEVSLNKKNITENYIIGYLYNTVLRPVVYYGDIPHPVYIYASGDSTNSDSWLFYTNDGYGGTYTKNYANIVCVRSFTEVSGVKTVTQKWYKFTGIDGYLNITGGSLKTNDKMAAYVKNNSGVFSLIN